jgi:hypothetical protein
MDTVRRILVCFLVLFSSSTQLFSTPLLPSNTYRTGDLSVFSENGKVGLKDNRGQVVIPASYDELGWSNGSFSIVNNITGYRKNDLWGLLNVETRRTTKAEFVDISFGAGSILVVRKRIPGTIQVKAGAINTSSKEIIPFAYDGLSISAFRAIVYNRVGNQFKTGLIDFENNVLIPLQYKRVYPLGSLRYAVENFDGKTAIFSDAGQQITSFLIDSISSFKKNLAVIYQNQRQGVMDREGVVKLEAMYREVRIHEDGTVDVRQPDSWLMLDGQNRLLQEVNADSILPLSKDLYKLCFSGMFTLSNQKFESVVPDLFSSIGSFNTGRAIVQKGNRVGIVRENGTFVLPASYDALVETQNFILAKLTVDAKKRWIILNSEGQKITQQHYERVLPFNGKFFPVKNRGYWGAVSAQGKEIIACAHDTIADQKDEKVVVRFKGKYGILDLNERWRVIPQSNMLALINDSLYFERNSKTTFVKHLGGNIVYFTDNVLQVEADHFVEHLSSGSTWHVDFNGRISQKLVEPELVQEVFPESEGYRAILKNGRYGFVDSRGRLRIANRYESVKEFNQGLAAIMIRGKWGFINKEDKIAIQPVYDEVNSFKENYAVVKQKNLFGLIDKNGKLILPVRYNEIVVNSPTSFLVRQNDAWGLSDSDGRMIINPKYDLLSDVGNGYIIVKQHGKFGLLTEQGLSTIPLIYDALSYDSHHDRFVALKRATWEKVAP